MLKNEEKNAPIVKGKKGAANGDETVKAAISKNVIRFHERIKEIIRRGGDTHRDGKVFVFGVFYCTEEQWVHALRVNPL